MRVKKLNSTQLAQMGYISLCVCTPEKAKLVTQFLALKGVQTYQFPIVREIPNSPAKKLMIKFYIKIK